MFASQQKTMNDRQERNSDLSRNLATFPSEHCDLVFKKHMSSSLTRRLRFVSSEVGIGTHVKVGSFAKPRPLSWFKLNYKTDTTAEKLWRSG